MSYNTSFIDIAQAQQFGSPWQDLVRANGGLVCLPIQEGRPKEWVKSHSDKVLANSAALMNAAPSSFGYQVAIDTLTQIRSRIVEQKFYEVNPIDYVPIEVGFGAWQQFLTTYRTYESFDDPEDGFVNEASESKISRAGVAFDAITTPIKNWADSYAYSIFEVNQAMASGNWSLIEMLERARKKKWDLLVQKIAFLGSERDARVKGLLNQDGVTSNDTIIPTGISQMDNSGFRALIRDLFKAYYINSGGTALPDTFVIPTSDWLGLGVPTDDAFSLRTKRDYLTEEFKKATNNENAKVLPVTYADKSFSSGLLPAGKNRYALYKRDQDNLFMSIPVAYTSTVIGTSNGIQFESGAFGQISGVQLLRDKQIMYFDNTANL